MKIQKPFVTGLLGGLGVLLAIAIGGALLNLATIFTYVLTAVFLALGLDPIIRRLQRLRLPRALAMLVVVVVVLAIITTVLLLIVPLIVNQTGQLVKLIANALQKVSSFEDLENQIQAAVGDSVNVKQIVNDATSYLQQNAGTIGGGLLGVVGGVAQAVGGTIIVVILTLYLAASLDSFKSSLYRLVPMTKREQFADIAEQIFDSVGKYVTGQVGLALVNGVLSFIFLTIIGAQLPAVFAFIAFIGSLIPLVGSISAAVIIVLGQLALNITHPQTWITVAVYYVVYLQVEAYLLSPRIMNRAVKVPGVVVVLAALIGGTLLGILGALIAIPVAAAILLIIGQVVIPRQAKA